MKKITKKHLMLLVTVVALISAVFFAMPMASAAECDCVTPILIDGNIIEPTCTTDGYTEQICSVHRTVLGKKDIKRAFGHGYGEWQFEATGEDYNKFRQCERCNTVHYELTGENRAVYHKVTYINPWDTDTQENLRYTKLALTFKDEVFTFESEEALDNIFRGEYYVIDGGTAAYIGKTPYREKDRAFGKYDFAGWTDGTTFYAKDETPTITEDTVLKAEFIGDTEVFYYVTFFKENGAAISKELNVRHGQPIDDSQIIQYTAKEATVSTIYTFNGWDVDISAIYGNAGIMAKYTETPQRYKYVFYKYDGTPFYSSDGTTALTETCDYGGVSNVGLGISADATAIARPQDLTYVYSWTGEWELKNRPGYKIDLNNLTVPVGTDPEVEEVQITPVYNKRLRVYDLEVTLEFPAEVAENAPSFYGDSTVVQITNAAGQYLGGGETKIVYKTENGVRVPYITFTCPVNYSSTYFVTAVTYDDKYTGEGSSIYVNEYGPTKITVNMVKADTDEHCGCICHNVLLRPLWARILNLIYNIFGRKIVCCDDMYATLGDLLAYTK